MRINHNISSMHTQSSLFKANRSMSKSIEKLSTGLRINRASDDAAGLGVSENLRTQVRGMGQALRNVQDSIAMLNIADGALNEQASLLQRMRELVIQAKNDTYTETERGYMGQEFKALMDEIDRIAVTANYNGMQLFAAPEQTDGTLIFPNNLDSSKTPHEIANGRTVWDTPDQYLYGADEFTSSHHFNMMVGANFTEKDAAAYNSGITKKSWDKDAENMLTIQFGQMDSNSILSYRPSWGIDASNYLETNGNPFGWDPDNDAEDATMAGFFTDGGSVSTKLNMILNIIDGDVAEDGFSDFIAAGNHTGLDRINLTRAYIGATVNRLEHASSNMINQINNTQSAESIIRDADFASETAEFTRNSILTQSATAMLAQANVTSQSVLQLLG